MKKVISLTAALVVSVQLCFAQTANEPKFGKVSLEELQMKSSPLDSTAEAVVLGDYGTVDFEFRNGGQVIHRRHTRIKILKKSAYDRATVKFSLYRKDSKTQEVNSMLKGSTFNLVDGKIVEDKLEKTAIFEEKTSKYGYVKRFTLPNVREGSVIDYTYEIISDFYEIPTWVFQRDIPTMWSEIRLQIPEYFFYRLDTRGFEPLTISKNEQGSKSYFIKADLLNASTTDYHFAIKDAPALKAEAYITTMSDYANKITFDLASINIPDMLTQNYSNNINSMSTGLMESLSFGKWVGRSSPLKEALEPLAKNVADTVGRLVGAYNLVRSSVK
jgi:Domain of Unknown Function with PDB structure (DUF3857)